MEILQKQWKKHLAKLSSSSGEYFSSLDNVKISEFESKFKGYAKAFDYSSVSVDDITISKDKYTPLVKGFDIKFDSSASDSIRLIWAYASAMAEVSFNHRGNHPQLLIMDEPGQQQMDTDSQKTLFDVLAKLNSQVIVASSLKVDELKEVTEDLKVNIINLGDEYIIKPIR